MTPKQVAQLQQLVDEVLAEPPPAGRQGSPERSLYAAVIGVRHALRQLPPAEQPTEKR